MKPDDILDAIGNVEEIYVKKAKEKKKSHWMTWIAVSSIAACVAVMIGIPFLSFFLHGAGSSAPPGGAEDAATLVRADVWIYYVDGEEISRQEEWLQLSAEDIFYMWRDKNGLGEDVQFIRAEIDSNGKTVESENIVNHEVGDYFVYNLTITKSIENYYDIIDSELLLESLKQTMLEYSDIDYNEYHLKLE